MLACPPSAEAREGSEWELVPIEKTKEEADDHYVQPEEDLEVVMSLGDFGTLSDDLATHMVPKVWPMGSWEMLG